MENAIAKQPEANSELSRNWLSKEQLPPAIESAYFQIKFDMSSSDDGVWYPHTGGKTSGEADESAAEAIRS